MQFHSRFSTEADQEEIILRYFDSQEIRFPVYGSIDHCAFQYNEYLESVSIPHGTVRTIRDWAFFGCGNLKTVLLPSGLESIGENAFAQTYLQEIYLPDTLCYLGESCFEDTMLEAVTIPGGIHRIGADTFRGNQYLHTVCLQEGVQSIDNGAFAWCPQLRELYIPDSLEEIGPDAFEGSLPIQILHASPRWRLEHPHYVQMLMEGIG